MHRQADDGFVRPALLHFPASLSTNVPTIFDAVPYRPPVKPSKKPDNRDSRAGDFRIGGRDGDRIADDPDGGFLWPFSSKTRAIPRDRFRACAALL